MLEGLVLVQVRALAGRGDYGLGDWERAMSEANRLSDIDASFFIEQPDLHEHLMKGVYELERTLRPTR
jgi:hypothetical protein